VEEEGVGNEGEVRVGEVIRVGSGSEEVGEVGEDGGWGDGEERVGVDEEGMFVLRVILLVFYVRL
jgi:hypothetical protein